MAATTFLQGLCAPDLGILIDTQYALLAATDLTETLNQTVTYGDAFGTNGPVLRTVRVADEDQLSFTCTYTKSGLAKSGMPDEQTIRGMTDFEIMVTRGAGRYVYYNCNWTTLVITSGLDTVTLQATISVPGIATSADVSQGSAGAVTTVV